MLGSNELDPEGWEVPFHLGLIKPMLTLGVQRELAIGLGTFGAATFFYITAWLLPLVLVAWVLAALLTKADPDGLKVAKRYWHQQSHYYG